MRPLIWYWWDLRYWWHRAIERTQWKIAWLIPRKIALYVFVRVYAVTGDCGPDYDRVYKAWERGLGK